jgi:predicted hydrocarbon binding protein
MLKQIEASTMDVLRGWGYLYLYLTRPVFEQWGIEGEKAIRKGLRSYGKGRGERLRKWHLEERLPINLESAGIYWYYMSSHDESTSKLGMGRPTREESLTPYHAGVRKRYLCLSCPFHDVLREANFQHYGYVYCEEIHHEVIMTYHPHAAVNIHECLMKGDDVCDFKYLMIPEIPEGEIDKSGLEALRKREKEHPVEFGLFFLKRDVYDFIGSLYYCLADAIVNRFGEKGRTHVKSALVEIGRRRGRELKGRLTRAGLDTTWKNIFDNFDLPYTSVWKMNLETHDRALKADVEYCPLAECWNQLENKDLGPMYCETIYDQMFKELFGERVKVKIPQSQAKGDSKCRFEFEV